MRLIYLMGLLLLSVCTNLASEILPCGGESETVSRFQDPHQDDQWETLSGEVRSAIQEERFLQNLVERSDVSALSVAVITRNRVVFQREMGILNEKSGKAVDGKTVFRTASISKPVFAYLVMKLIDEGLLEIDRPLFEYLDRPLYEYPDYEDLKGDERYKLLTVRFLLSHQSGFPNWRMMNRGGRLDFKFTPGEKFQYSGEGYQFLKFIIEKITGKELNRLAKEKVFDPLGMENSSFLWERRFNDNLAINLDTGLRRLIERTKTAPNAAASLLTNTSDYAKFLLAIMKGQGLKPETLELMLTTQVAITSKSLHALQGTDLAIRDGIRLGWALGWGRFSSPAGEVIFHVGFEEGCDNYAVIFLDKKIGIVLQSVITTRKGIAPLITKELIGDSYSPFAWLMY